MKYLDVITGEEITIYPWSSHIKKAVIKNNPDRYHELFEE